MGIQKNRLIETILLSTESFNMLKLMDKKIIKFYAQIFCLSRPIDMAYIIVQARSWHYGT